jgi:hypothetical protein
MIEFEMKKRVNSSNLQTKTLKNMKNAPKCNLPHNYLDLVWFSGDCENSIIDSPTLTPITTFAIRFD